MIDGFHTSPHRKQGGREFDVACVAIASLMLLSFTSAVCAHEGPDPLAHWLMNARSVADGQLNARLGPAGKLSGDYEIVQDALGDSLYFSGASRGLHCGRGLS